MVARPPKCPPWAQNCLHFSILHMWAIVRRRSQLSPKNRQDLVSANTATSEPQCYKKSDGSQYAHRGPQIYQINRQYNSYQNMCDMLQAKIDHFARKLDSLQKQYLKNGYFCLHESVFTCFWKALDATRLTPGQLQAYL